MSHILTTPNQMKQLLFSKDATGRRASNGGPSKNIGKKKKKKKERGERGPKQSGDSEKHNVLSNS